MGKQKYYFEPKEIIAKGLKNVQDTVRGLNYEFTDKEKDSFYYIRAKIKLFDDLGLDNYYKKMIYLIDFPGFGTGNVFEKKLYKKVMSICNSFIFVVRNSVIKEQKNKELLEDIFTQARNQKNKLSSGFIKNCLFVLNNDNSQTTTKEDIDNAKRDINELIKVNENDINSIFFNAKFYGNYIDNFNYFFKIKNTFNDEYKKYHIYNNNLFKYPEKYIDKKNVNFCGFIYKEIGDKIKKANFGKNIGKDQNFNEKAKNEMNETIEEFKNNRYIKNNEFTPKNLEIIGKLFSFAQNNINELPTLKESNIEEFKKTLHNQINYYNRGMQEELKINLDKVITTLNYFFNQDFSNRKQDLEEFNKFTNNIEDIIQKMKSFKIKEEIERIKNDYEITVINSLNNKKENIEKLLQKQDWKEIKKEIDEEMNENLVKFNKEIQSSFKLISDNSFLLYQKAKYFFSDFTKDDVKLDDFSKFNEYFLEKVANKDGNFSEEISKEIRNCIEHTMSEIYKEEGLLASISSTFFDSKYLTEMIGIIIKYYTKHTKYILDLLKNTFHDYINSIIFQIKTRRAIITFRYTESQNLEWKKLCTIWANKRENIRKDLDIICKKSIK